MKNRNLRSITGVTMVEIMIALFILGLILGPLMLSFMQSSRIIRIGIHDLEVLNIGYSFVSQVRKLRSGLLPETGGEQPLPQPGGDGIVRLGGPGAGNPIIMPNWDPRIFSIKYRISAFPIAPTADGIPRQGKIVVLKVTAPGKIGPQRPSQFPVLLIDE